MKSYITQEVKLNSKLFLAPVNNLKYCTGLLARVFDGFPDRKNVSYSYHECKISRGISFNISTKRVQK